MVVNVPFTGETTFPSSGTTTTPFPNIPIANASSLHSVNGNTLPFNGLAMTSFLSKAAVVCISGVLFSALSVTVCFSRYATNIIINANIIAIAAPLIAMIILPFVPSGFIIAGNSNIPIPPAKNFLKLKCP